jgi:DNA primase
MGYLMERFHNSWNEIQKQSAIEVGILSKSKNGLFGPVFKNCVVFPIKNKDGRIINLYGRSILPDKENTAKHFYLKGAHRGIFPKLPRDSDRVDLGLIQHNSFSYLHLLRTVVAWIPNH